MGAGPGGEFSEEPAIYLWAASGESHGGCDGTAGGGVLHAQEGRNFKDGQPSDGEVHAKSQAPAVVTSVSERRGWSLAFLAESADKGLSISHASLDPRLQPAGTFCRLGPAFCRALLGLGTWRADVRSRSLAMGHSRSEFNLVGTPGPKIAFWR